MAEVFSGGVSVTGVEPGTTTIAIKSTTNPNISKKGAGHGQIP